MFAPPVGVTAVPVSGIICGEFEAFDAMVRLAVMEPAAVGANWTWMIPVAPGASVGVQPFDILNAELLAPDKVAPLMVRVAVPVFFTVMDCTVEVVFTFWLANSKLAGATLTDKVAVAVPVPLSARVWFGLEALSVIVTAPVREPVVAGWNWTCMAQL